jgi:hypothetical protein
MNCAAHKAATYDVLHVRDTWRAGGSEVARHDAAHARLLCGVEQRPLGLECVPGANAEEDVYTLQRLLERSGARRTNIDRAKDDSPPLPLFQARGRLRTGDYA